jgi:hypothetical protein
MGSVMPGVAREELISTSSMEMAGVEELLPKPTTTGIPLLGDDYLTQQDLARELNVSVRTIARWHVERIGPPRIVVRRLLLYRRAAVREWLESREEQPRRRGRR